MKVLTATATSQGTRANDFASTIEGELVWVDDPCARDRSDPDGGCGCGRAFFGLNSHRATTTALVRDLPLSREDVIKALLGYYESAGFGVVASGQLEPEIDGILAWVSTWDVGTVIERRLDVLRAR